MGFPKLSKSRHRYQMNGFDIDLSYITPRVIAMGFPYDNVYKDYFRFLETFHKDHYRVYNLCSERAYDKAKFHDRVAVFPFDEGCPPPIELIHHFCSDVDSWLRVDSSNVAVVHCTTGRERTGVMICAYLAFTGEWPSPEEALAFFSNARMLAKEAVSLPSHIRYVHYFSDLVKSGNAYSKVLVLLNKIVLWPKPNLPSGAEIGFRIYVLKTPVFSYNAEEDKKIQKSSKDKKPKKEKPKWKSVDEEMQPARLVLFNKMLDSVRTHSDDRQHSIFELLLEFQSRCFHMETQQGWENASVVVTLPSIPLCGDIKMEFVYKVGSTQEHLFDVWFNTAFIQEHAVIPKNGLDRGNKDPEFAPDFQLEIFAHDKSHQPASSGLETIISSALASSSTPGTSGSAGASGSAASSLVELAHMPQVSVLSSTQDAARIKCSSLVRSNFVSRELLQRAAETFLRKPPVNGCLNTEMPCSGTIREAESVSVHLLESIISIYLRCGYWGIALSDSVVGVSYHSEFPRFLSDLSELQSVDLSKLVTPDQKLAFWLNIRNTMALHLAAVVSLVPSPFTTLKPALIGAKMQEFRYMIAGRMYSIWEVDEAVLRAGLPPPENGLGPSVAFTADDPRVQCIIDWKDPRIPYATSLCTAASPAVWVFQSATVQEQLTTAMKTFVASYVTILPNIKQVYLAKFFQWYSRDFPSKNAQLEFIEQYLPASLALAGKKKQLKKKKSFFAKYDLRWNEHDWDLRVVLTHLTGKYDIRHAGTGSGTALQQPSPHANTVTKLRSNSLSGASQESAVSKNPAWRLSIEPGIPGSTSLLSVPQQAEKDVSGAATISTSCSIQGITTTNTAPTGGSSSEPKDDEA